MKTETQANQERGRLSARVALAVQERIELAATSLGTSVSQFITQASLEYANRVIEAERSIRLSIEEATRFHELLTNPPAPTEDLVRSVASYNARRNTNERGNTTFELKP